MDKGTSKKKLQQKCHFKKLSVLKKGLQLVARITKKLGKISHINEKSTVNRYHHCFKTKVNQYIVTRYDNK